MIGFQDVENKIDILNNYINIFNELFLNDDPLITNYEKKL